MYMARHTEFNINSMYGLCVCDACRVTHHVTKIFQAFSLLNSAHGSKVTYVKIIAGLRILRGEGKRRPGPGMEARKNHLFILLFMKLSDKVEACVYALPYA